MVVASIDPVCFIKLQPGAAAQPAHLHKRTRTSITRWRSWTSPALRNMRRRRRCGIRTVFGSEFHLSAEPAGLLPPSDCVSFKPGQALQTAHARAQTPTRACTKLQQHFKKLWPFYIDCAAPEGLMTDCFPAVMGAVSGYSGGKGYHKHICLPVAAEMCEKMRAELAAIQPYHLPELSLWM